MGGKSGGSSGGVSSKKFKKMKKKVKKAAKAPPAPPDITDAIKVARKDPRYKGRMTPENIRNKAGAGGVSTAQAQMAIKELTGK